MTATPTLNSRLRVLIAKTFRAEKLYSSIRTQHGDKLGNVSMLAEMANDVRAKEWERSHYQLRAALNDILSLGANSAVLAEILQLRERFYRTAEESSAMLESGVESLVENIRRHEFAHAFKTSVELIRLKARAQASKVIIEELSAVLEASGRPSTAVKPGEDGMRAFAPAEKQGADEPQAARAMAEQPRSNVIPLRRKFAVGSN